MIGILDLGALMRLCRTSLIVFAVALIVVGMPELAAGQNSIAQREPVADRAIDPTRSENPSATITKDAERQVTDQEQLACTALKSAYENCSPACGETCKAIYEDVRFCPKVSSRC